MAKKPYAEQLKHPKWQKKRLEVLEREGWQCQACGSSEKTLHVHHKHYVKGRQVWEYESGDLEALCEDCHEEAHRAKQKIDAVLAQVPSSAWGAVASLLVGFFGEIVDTALWLEIEEEGTARAGQLAAFVAGNMTDDVAFEIADACRIVAPDRFLEAVRSAVDAVVPDVLGGERETNSEGPIA